MLVHWRASSSAVASNLPPDGMSLRARILAASLIVTASLAARRAAADCVSGQKVTTDCGLDLVTGPVLGSSRVVALGGAYQGLAEGIDGYTQNAASPAVREPWSYKWFNYDVDASISFPSAFRNIDFENRGTITKFTYQDFVFVTVGANVQLGAWGFGFFADLQNWNISPNAKPEDPSFSTLITKSHALIARQLFGGDLVAGIGARIIGFQINRSGGGLDKATVVSLSGLGAEAGILWKPSSQPFRLGVTVRSPVKTDDPGPGSATEVNGTVIPQRANLPWEIDTGIAVQGGPKPLNDPWLNPHDEESQLRTEIRYARAHRLAERSAILDATPKEERAAKARELDQADARARKEEDDDLSAFTDEFVAVRKARFDSLPREYLLFTLGLLVTGPTNNGISLESFFSQQIARSGRLTTFSPRAGVEAEVWPRYLKLRLGTYIEPTRFGSEPDSRAFRQHLTSGFDLYLFRWTVLGIFDEGTAWRLTTAIDVSPRYQNYGLSVGVWH